MTLSRCILGDYIELREEKNTNLLFGVRDIRGVNNVKKFMPTKVDVGGRDLSKFQIVSPGDFVFNHRTSRNGSKFSIALNDSDKTIICTEDYVVFRIKEESKDVILPEWLYMFFNRPEFDRFVITNSWGSSTEFYNWEDICAVELELPPLSVQKKYVDIYLSMLANQKAYEEGLEDLKLSCDMYIENLRKTISPEAIGQYIKCTDRKNSDASLAIMGISNKQVLQPSESRTAGVDKTKYLQIDTREFAYSPIHINDGSIAFNNKGQSFLLSPIYKTFKIIDENILFPEYLMLWFTRSEFIRYCSFHAFGSARDTFDWEQMCEVSIPIPDIETQHSIANIFKTYCSRKEINESLKKQLSSICPILIKGSLEEAIK